MSHSLAKVLSKQSRPIGLTGRFCSAEKRSRRYFYNLSEVIPIKGIVKQDIRVVWKTPQERGTEDIPEGAVIDVLDKFYNYCINGYYYRAKIPQNEAVYYFLPDDVEVRGKIKEVEAR